MANAPSSTRPSLACIALLASLTVPAYGQRVQPARATDSSTQASPLNARPNSPVDDGSTQASPTSAGHATGSYIAPHTPVHVLLGEAIDSGSVKQGQSVRARLTSPLSVHGGPMLPAGTAVELSIIAAVPAGRMMAQGELSLQLLRIGNMSVYADTLVFDGKPGHQDLPDSAPALGTNAGLASGAHLTFKIQPEPSANVTPLEATEKDTPGSVDGVAPGSAPSASQTNSTYGNANKPAGSQDSAQQQKAVAPANTTTNQQTQHPAGPAPQQPSGATPTTSPRL